MMSFLIVSSMFLFSVSISAFVILPTFRSFPNHALFRSDIGSLKNSDTDVNELDDSDLDEIISLLESGEDLESLLLDDHNFWEEDPEESSFDSSDKEKTSAHTDLNPMINTFHRLIENHHEKHDNETAQNVETALFRILDEYEGAMQSQDNSKLTIIEPQANHFLSAMQVWIDSDSPGASDKVVALLLEQERFFQMTGLCIPNLEIFETALHALAESRRRQADRKAYAIFQRLDDYQVQPTLSLYHSLITCMARGRDHGAAKRAEDLLMEAAAKFPPRLESNGKRLGISVDTFNVVLTAWAKSELEDGPDRAKNLLLKMDTIDNQQGILKPTASSFTSLIDAYAQMNTWESACLAERTLNALLNYYLTEELDPTLEPNIATWGIVLSCWQRLSKKGSSDAAANAAKLLDRLETLYSDGKLTYGPDAIAYATVLNAFCQCKDATKEGAKNAELILNEMNERYMDGDDSFKPSSKSIRSVIDAWLKSSRQDAVFKAQETFKKFDDMDYLSDPSDVSIVKEIYKAFIFAWSKNEDAELAHEYLIDMYDQGLQPDSFCFDKVIEAYTAEEGNTINEVKEVLKLMEKSNQENELKPNERIYTSFIRAMTKDNIPNLASESYDVLKKMNDLSLMNKGVKPTVFTYNAVLKACATAITEDPSENLKTLKIALGVFNELRAPDTKEEPDHVTYGNMLQCSALLPQGNQREALITSTFQMCCRNGFVNSFVIRDLKTTATEELWRDLCHCPLGDVDIEKLPQEWVKRSKVFVKNKVQEGRRMPSRGGGARYQKK